MVSIDSTYNENIQTLQEYVDYLDNQLNMFYTSEKFECSNISMYEELKLNETELFYFDETSNSIKILNDISLEKQKEFFNIFNELSPPLQDYLIMTAKNFESNIFKFS